MLVALASMQRRLDSSIIAPKTEQNPEQKNMTATRHAKSTLNAHRTTNQPPSHGLPAGAFA
jgi:hypothetical protein